MSAEPLEHQGVGVHPTEWRPGVTCDDCRARLTLNMAKHGKAPMVNIGRLRADNAGGYTQLGIAKETYDAARASGEDIQVAR